jgi:hypothetical protein
VQDIKYSTTEEKRMIEGIQKSYGAVANGVIGNQTLSEIAKDKCPEVFPLTLELYGMPTIIGKDIILFDPGGGLKNFDNSVSGSYSYPSGKTPCSIMVNDGKTICGSASHAWLGFKESVIYEKIDGTIGICRAMYDTEIPDRSNVKWAIGGAGLLGNYNPKLEGFAKFTVNGKTYNYSDVWRRTNHTVLGVKNGWIYGVYCKNMTGPEINAFCKDKMKFDIAILLDGGHIAAINSAEIKINTAQSQGYAIQWR